MDSVFRFVKKVGHEARSNFPEVLTNLSLPNFGLPTLQLGNRKIQLVKQLGEGGFAFVFLGKDVETQQPFAVKRMIASDRDDMKKIQDEIDSMQKVQHKNIVTLVGTTTIKSPQGRTEVYLVLEFCEGGSLYSILDQRFKNYFTETQILNIFSDVCEGVFALHSLDPPICHRDIKVENVLLTRNTFKLCDFGSCTTKTYFPQTSSEMSRAEDDINRNTTMSYRSPEMLDLYRHQLINEKADIWALGILLYRICFFKHPFDETSRIAALNVKYEIPEDSPYSANIHNLIKFMIEPDPEVRPNIGQVLRKVFELRGVECPCDLRSFLDPAAQQTQKQRSIELSKAAPVVSNPLASAFEWQGGSGGSAFPTTSVSSSSASGSGSAAPVIVNPRRLSGGAPADANSLFFSSPGAPSQPAVSLTNSGGLTRSQDLSSSSPAASSTPTPTPAPAAASFDFFAEATSFSQPSAATVSSTAAPSNPDDFFSMFAAPAPSPAPTTPSPSVQKPLVAPITPVSVQAPSPVAVPAPMNRSGSFDFLTSSGPAPIVPQAQVQPQIFPQVSPAPSPLSSSNGAAKPGSLVDMLFAQPQASPAPLSPFTNFTQPQAGPSFISPTPSYQVPLAFSSTPAAIPSPSHQQAFSQIASAATTTNSASRRPGADPFKNLNWQ